MALPPITPLRAMPAPKSSNSMRGIALMALGFFVFSGADTIGKFLTGNLHPIQIVWFRQSGLLIGVLILIGLRGRGVLRSSQPKLQVTRGVLAAFSATLFIAAVAYVPLADAVAITFVAPFIVTVMGALILKEPVGLRRWCAVIIGFLATLIVIRPGLGVMHPAAFLLVVAAGCFALRQVLSRLLAGGDTPETTIAYTAIVSWVLLSLPLPFIWQTPSWGLEVGLLMGIALLGAVGETLVIKALDMAHAVVLAPVQYSMLIWGTFYGYFVFGQMPDGWTWFGALIIVATGLYTLNRERLAASSGAHAQNMQKPEA